MSTSDNNLDTGPFNERQAHFVVGCVIEAIDYLHSWGVVYRDLKPENLMTDDQGYIIQIPLLFFHKNIYIRIRKTRRLWICQTDWTQNENMDFLWYTGVCMSRNSFKYRP